MKKHWITPLLMLATVACVAPTTALVEASAAQRDTVFAQGSIARRLVNDPQNGMAADVRAVYLTALEEHDRRARVLHDAIVGYATDVGTVDWSRLKDDAKEIADQVKLLVRRDEEPTP